MADNEEERTMIQAALNKVAAEFKDVVLGVEVKKEYAAVSELTKCALMAAKRAVAVLDIKDADRRDCMTAKIAVEIMRLTIRRQEPQPQVVMVPTQGGGMQIPGNAGPFGFPPLS